MAKAPLHVLFGASAAGSLRKALASVGREDRVVSLMDDLSFGPINPPAPKLRAEWVGQEMGYADWPELDAKIAAFWQVSLSREERLIAWFSRRSTADYTGFLEWLWRLRDVPCEIVDVTDVMIVHRRSDGRMSAPELAIGVGELSPENFLVNGLLDRAATLDPSARNQYHETWRRLREENAPLRVLTERGIESAPISFFDSLLLSCVTSTWRKTARVVGETLTKSWADSLHQTGDMVLAARVRALAETGLLESRGDLFRIQHSEVRLPSKENVEP